MVICIVPGCSKRSDRDKGVAFFRLPTIRTGKNEEELELSRRRRAGYLAAIGRDLSSHDLSNVRICSKHFISGRPAYLFDQFNPDWLPTQNVRSRCNMKALHQCHDRYLRRKSRNARIHAPPTEPVKSSTTPVTSIDSAHIHAAPTETVKLTPVTSVDSVNVLIEADEPSTDDIPATEVSRYSDAQSQTEDNIAQLRTELNNAYETIHTLRTKVSKITPFTELTLQDQQKKFIKHYTGLPSFEVLKAVYDFVSSSSKFGNTKLEPFREFVLTLVKLRHNFTYQDLAYRFDVHYSTVSRIFLKWLTIMDIRLGPLIIWPTREILWKTTPECFHEEFGCKVCVILDCFEVFIERPSNLLARACTWSSYKHHNTVKFLIGIAPQGTVSYISAAWGGRVSDKYLTENCGVLNKLLPGDIVLADRGFDIADSVSAFQARLHIPAFTRGKDQLSAAEVEETRSLANVRIHVERVIGAVRQKYATSQTKICACTW